MGQENFVEEMKKQLREYKSMIDSAYDTTSKKYGVNFANEAILDFYLRDRLNGFTRDNSARANMKYFEQSPYRKEQILFDYAISSFILNDMKCDISDRDLSAYANDKEGSLNYDSMHATKILAVACAVNPSWAYGLISMNQRLKEVVVVNFLIERYGLEKKEQLDNCHNSRLIKLTDRSNKPIFMSKDRLNNEIRLMIELWDFSYGLDNVAKAKR